MGFNQAAIMSTKPKRNRFSHSPPHHLSQEGQVQSASMPHCQVEGPVIGDKDTIIGLSEH